MYSFAQRGGIRSQVLDETKQPLPGDNITTIETKAGTDTGFDGNYELINTSSGKYKVSTSLFTKKQIANEI